MNETQWQVEGSTLAVMVVTCAVALGGCGLFGGDADSAVNDTGSMADAGGIDTEMSDRGDTGPDARRGTAEFNWVRLEGSSSIEAANSVAVDDSGAAYMVGETTQTEVWGGIIAKYSATGERKWGKLFGSGKHDNAVDVAVGPSGAVYVAGCMNGESADQVGNHCEADPFVTKFTPSGSISWSRAVENSSVNARAEGIAVSSSGEVFVAGETGGELGDQSYAGGADDAFLMKYDSSGSRQWVRLFGTPAFDVASGVAVSDSGGVFVSGGTSGSLGGRTVTGSRDAFVARFDSSGNRQWVRLFGTGELDFATGVDAGGDGTIGLTGITQGDFAGKDNRGESDAFTVAYSASGNQKWARLVGSVESEWTEDVAVDSTGAVIFAGASRSDTVADRLSNGPDDVLTAKYGSSGERQWIHLIGTETEDDGTGVTVDSSDTVYLAGESEGELAGRQNAGGGGDAFLLTLK